MPSLVCLAPVVWVVTAKIVSKEKMVDFDTRQDHLVAIARCLSVMEITLRTMALFTWNKSKGETVCLVVNKSTLVVKCGCHCPYAIKK